MPRSLLTPDYTGVFYSLWVQLPRSVWLTVIGVEQLRRGCSGGGHTADGSCLTATAADEKPQRGSLWLQRGVIWSVGDLARDWFDQMPWSFLRGSLLLTGE
jgi:hypothetical protein